jgi:hypothetical protein
MCRMRTHAHENREPATTRWVRAAGADKMRAAAQRAHLGASTPPVFEGVTSVPATGTVATDEAPMGPYCNAACH